MRNRVVLDTNCLIMALSRHSEFYPVWMGIQTGKYILCVSNDILDEYHEIITQKTSVVVADNVIRLLSECAFVEYIDPRYHLELIEADPDAVVDLMSTTKKAYRKEQNKKFKPAGEKLSNKKIGKAKHKSIYWGAVLKSGFETKR